MLLIHWYKYVGGAMLIWFGSGYKAVWVQISTW